jgi:RNA polymerase sigma factor (sigma-70 family)
VERHAPLVNGILRGVYRLGMHDAEDAFQDVFTRLYLNLATVREVRPWVAQVARNLALDRLRQVTRESPSGNDVEEGAFTEPMAALDEALSIRDALQRLPEHQREILDRFFVRDESYRVIAATLDLPPGTIASRISRALAALRAELEGRSDASATSS